MWIVTNKGFLSIVAKGRDGKASPPDIDAVVSVRFRRPKDAKALFPTHEVVMTPKGDYACRIFATRGEVAEVVFRETVGISYTNFKSSIPAADAALNRAAHKAWDVFGDLQDGGPYGRDLRSPQPSYAARTPYLPSMDGWDDPVWRLPKAEPAKGKAKVRKAKRSDPFCDGCGMRYGVKNLDDSGYCHECAAIVAEPVRSGDGPEWSPPGGEPSAGGPGECWNCATHAPERNEWKLCGECAHLYTGTDTDLLESIIAGLHVD
jgi:hypothetical protein